MADYSKSQGLLHSLFFFFYKKINIRSSLIGDKARGAMGMGLEDLSKKYLEKLHANAIGS